MRFLICFNFFYLVSCFLFAQNDSGGTEQSNKISPYLIGQNLWGRTDVFNVVKEVRDVKYQTIRIGGNGYENADFMTKAVIDYIDYVRASGAEPLLQLPRQLKNDDKAFKAIAYLNGKLKKNIKFWSIGNEPDHKNQLASPEEVFDYFTKIAEQIKRYDPEAKIMGFDLASYSPKYINRLLGGDLDLTGRIPGKNYYYLDMVSLHNYRFVDISGFEEEVIDLKKRLGGINKYRESNHQIGWAITEFNSHWMVDPALEERYLPYTFHNGQIFAEMYDLGMREGAFTICPWSILEGDADREGTDLSMFDLKDGRYYPRSNYYHTSLLAQHFRENYLGHSDNQQGVVIIPMGDEEGVSVMILNKNRQSGYKYSLRLDKGKQSSKTLQIAINAGINKKYKAKIDPLSTQMLIFNRKGKLIKRYIYSQSDADAMKPPRLSK